jgi:hypothetical protein
VTGSGRELVERNGQAPSCVDPEEEPSAAWGWHGDFPRGKVIMGWLTVGSLIAIQFGNHQGHVENLWLDVIALLVACGLVHHHLKARRSWYH